MCCLRKGGVCELLVKWGWSFGGWEAALVFGVMENCKLENLIACFCLNSHMDLFKLNM